MTDKKEVSPELQAKASKVSKEIQSILVENGMALSTEFMYLPSGISAKPILIETQQTPKEKPVVSPLSQSDGEIVEG